MVPIALDVQIAPAVGTSEREQKRDPAWMLRRRRWMQGYLGTLRGSSRLHLRHRAALNSVGPNPLTVALPEMVVNYVSGPVKLAGTPAD
jgi:hypothetical protein